MVELKLVKDEAGIARQPLGAHAQGARQIIEARRRAAFKPRTLVR